MRAQLVAVFRAKGAFQQGAENGGFNLFPVFGRGINQQGQLNFVQWQGGCILEQAAVEFYQIGGQRLGKAAIVHGFP